MTQTAPTDRTTHPDPARVGVKVTSIEAIEAVEAMDAADCVLDISGMTCAACVNRVEKALNKVEGVHAATVNLAAETAAVHFDPTLVDLTALTGAVTKAGYAGTPRLTLGTTAGIDSTAVSTATRTRPTPATQPTTTGTPARTPSSGR